MNLLLSYFLISHKPTNDTSKLFLSMVPPRMMLKRKKCPTIDQLEKRKKNWENSSKTFLLVKTESMNFLLN